MMSTLASLIAGIEAFEEKSGTKIRSVILPKTFAKEEISEFSGGSVFVVLVGSSLRALTVGYNYDPEVSHVLYNVIAP